MVGFILNIIFKIERNKFMLLLKGYDSETNSYLVNDYPYGFSLRCKIRYWLEYSEKLGYRFCSQTSNPKKNDIWNKPKKSTYIDISACMYLDVDNHVTWTGLTHYSNLNECLLWKELYYEGLSDIGKQRLDEWIKTKTIYEEKIANGVPWQIAGKETVCEMVKGKE